MNQLWTEEEAKEDTVCNLSGGCNNTFIVAVAYVQRILLTIFCFAWCDIVSPSPRWRNVVVEIQQRARQKQRQGRTLFINECTMILTLSCVTLFTAKCYIISVIMHQTLLLATQTPSLRWTGLFHDNIHEK